MAGVRGIIRHTPTAEASMIVRGVALAILESIAASVGVTLYNVRPSGKGGYAFTLRPIREKAKRGTPAKWQRESHTGRKVWAVCWHGHYAFMSEMFARIPSAVLRSSMATYRGRDDFNAKADGTGTRNVGSMMQPRVYADACVCWPYGASCTYRPVPTLRG